MRAEPAKRAAHKLAIQKPPLTDLITSEVGGGVAVQVLAKLVVIAGEDGVEENPQDGVGGQKHSGVFNAGNRRYDW